MCYLAVSTQGEQQGPGNRAHVHLLIYAYGNNVVYTHFYHNISYGVRCVCMIHTCMRCPLQLRLVIHSVNNLSTSWWALTACSPTHWTETQQTSGSNPWSPASWTRRAAALTNHPPDSVVMIRHIINVSSLNMQNMFFNIFEVFPTDRQWSFALELAGPDSERIGKMN